MMPKFYAHPLPERRWVKTAIPGGYDPTGWGLKKETTLTSREIAERLQKSMSVHIVIN